MKFTFIVDQTWWLTAESWSWLGGNASPCPGFPRLRLQMMSPGRWCLQTRLPLSRPSGNQVFGPVYGPGNTTSSRQLTCRNRIRTLRLKNKHKFIWKIFQSTVHASVLQHIYIHFGLKLFIELEGKKTTKLKEGLFGYNVLGFFYQMAKCDTIVVGPNLFTVSGYLWNNKPPEHQQFVCLWW